MVTRAAARRASIASPFAGALILLRSIFLFSHPFAQVMMKLTDVLFKRKSDEPEKEFTFTEFLNLVDR